MKKVLSLLLVLCMVLGMSVSVLAEGEQYGTVEGITGGVAVEGSGANVVVATYEPAVLQWFPADTSIGRYQDGWWVGIKVTAPAGIEDSALADVKYTSNGTEKSFWANKDSTSSPHFITLWGPVTVESYDAARESGTLLKNVWTFDWNKDGTYEQSVTLQIDPDQLILVKEGDGWSQVRFPYEILNPSELTWTKGSEEAMRILTSSTYDYGYSFSVTSVKVDGTETDEYQNGVLDDKGEKKQVDCYVDLSAEYLETLSVGEHELKINWPNGAATAKFTIAEATTPVPTPKPVEDETPAVEEEEEEEIQVSGSSVGSSNSSTNEATNIPSSAVSDAIDNALKDAKKNEDTTPTVQIKVGGEGSTITRKSLAEAQENNVTLEISGSGFTWSFAPDSVDMSAFSKNFKPYVDVDANPTTSLKSELKASDVTSDEVQIVKTEFSGEFDGEVELKVKLNKELRGKNNLNLYYWNDKTDNVELVATNLNVKGNYAVLKLTHCSSYVLTDKTLNAVVTDKGVSNSPSKTNPETGAVDFVGAALALTVCSAACGAALSLKNK